MAEKKWLVKICDLIEDFEDLEKLLNSEYKVTGHATRLCQDGREEVVYILELKEPEEAKIISIKSVDINEADQYLQQGYEVRESFSKNVTIVRKAEKTKISEEAKEAAELRNEVAELQGY